METEILIIGSGISGAISALELAKKGVRVTLIASGKGNSPQAQGGITYQSSINDSALLKKDIIKAGHGLCSEDAVDQFVSLGPKFLKAILIDETQVPFEKFQNGKWKLTKEAAHSIPRILYKGDATGAAIMEAVLKKVDSHPLIKIRNDLIAVDLITCTDNATKKSHLSFPATCLGIYVLNKGKLDAFFAKETVLATGGIGEVFLHSTNSKESRGDGIAMAHRAGLDIVNMEYVQFHPTALYHPTQPRFLLTEALRGEGGKILSHDYLPFMDELESRDKVARKVYEEMMRTGQAHLWLDISFKEKQYLKIRFPNIYQYCLTRGWDITKEPIPIVPAAHYICGGIKVDLEGRTKMKGLRAIGETACSGLHGANRLASTSLLEGLVWGKTCADSISIELKNKKILKTKVNLCSTRDKIVGKKLIKEKWSIIKKTMWNDVGIIRKTSGLKRAYKKLFYLKKEINKIYSHSRTTPELLDLRNGCEVAYLVTKGALQNKCSKGSHYRR